MAFVNWEEVKLKYITTDVSLRKLATEYGINPTTVYERSSNEGWVALRKHYRSEILAKTLDLKSGEEVDRLDGLIKSATKAIDVVVKAFSDEEQFYRYISKNKTTGEFVEKKFRKIDTQALRDLTTVLKDLTGLVRDFYDIPTPAQAEARRIAGERLEMDKKKLDEAENDTSEIEIVFSAGPEEWNE